MPEIFVLIIYGKNISISRSNFANHVSRHETVLDTLAMKK